MSAAVQINQKLPKGVVIHVGSAEVAHLMQRTGLPRRVVADKLEECIPSYLTIVTEALEDGKLIRLKEEQAKINADLEAALAAVKARQNRSLPLD